MFHCTIRFINQITKEIPYGPFSISFLYHIIVHENTFALTLPCFIWLSFDSVDTPASFLLLLSMFKLRCKRHYRNLATYSWCTTWREHGTKTASARRRHSVGGGGVSKMAAAAARRRRTFLVQIPPFLKCGSTGGTNCLQSYTETSLWCSPPVSVRSDYLDEQMRR